MNNQIPVDLKELQHAERSIALDFDGVIHAYTKGWHTKNIYDPPNEGAERALKTLSLVYGVFILSARDSQEIYNWCINKFPDIKFEIINDDVKHWSKIGVIGITNRKLPALAYVDDRSVRFTNWNDITNYFR